jgi:hypothetical protein
MREQEAIVSDLPNLFKEVEVEWHCLPTTSPADTKPRYSFAVHHS